jgi:hypothetical protein
MSFHNGEEYSIQRYHTYEAAVTGHQEIIEELKIVIENTK